MSSKNTKNATHGLKLLSILICLGLGFLSGYFVKISDFSWYVSLNKPSFNPPSWVFGPVWTILYIMIGLAAVNIFKGETLYPKLLFIIQFILNLLWSPLFFYLQRIGLALCDIAFLVISLALLIYNIRNQGYTFSLLMPYFLWVVFAAFLNYTIYVMNS